MSTSASSAEPIQLTGPFDSFRDYLTALEARGRLLRIGEMDQDRFEPAGFAYRMIEEHGFYKAPAFLIERVKINGRWMDGPVLGNVYRPLLPVRPVAGGVRKARSEPELSGSNRPQLI